MNYQEDAFTIDDQYLSAITTSNLRVQADYRGAADVLIAVGWSRGVIGPALWRLVSEWQSTGRARMLSPEAIERLAVEKGHWDSKTGCTIPDHDGAQAEALRWYLHEMKLNMQSLKSLPLVRTAAIAQAKRWNIEAPELVAASVIKWWLDQNCDYCEGRAQGEDGLKCKACDGTGKSRVPYGEAGRKLANLFDETLDSTRRATSLRLWKGKP